MHEYVLESGNEHESLFVCPADGCGRRVVYNRSRPDYIVIDRGDFFAQHRWARPGISMATTVQTR
jgi:hypothetical protein